MIYREIAGRDAISGRSIRVRIEEDRIFSVVPSPREESVWVSPGLVDVQVNGYGGCDVNSDSVDPDVILALARKLRQGGVTTFIPTIITASEEKIVKALRAIADARLHDELTAHSIPFVHVEGPHLSPEDGPRGAHPREHIRPPDFNELRRWQSACGHLVGMVTISPHWAGAAEYISAAVAEEVRVAIGHTQATPEQVHMAADAGATLSTHLGNGLSDPLPRHPNLLWAQLADDRLMASFIADGHHLPDDILKTMIRAKGVERSLLISDAVALAGMKPDFYNTPVGGRVELHANGRLNIADTNFLAGAVRPLKDGIAHLVTTIGLGLGDALRMACGNPGRMVGKRGTLLPGSIADLVQFTFDPVRQNLQVETVLVRGVEGA